VVRVSRGGSQFTIYVIDSRDERGIVTKSFGPFAT
jgi:hypothetical protein